MAHIIRKEQLEDIGDINKLHQKRLGPGRFAKTSYRIREKAAYDISCSHVALIDENIIGSVRQTWTYFKPEQKCLFLGPLVVEKEASLSGVGQALLKAAIMSATECEAQAIILIGDYVYYKKVGFEVAKQLGHCIILPGPADVNRILIKNISLKQDEFLEGNMKPFEKKV